MRQVIARCEAARQPPQSRWCAFPATGAAPLAIQANAVEIAISNRTAVDLKDVSDETRTMAAAQSPRQPVCNESAPGLMFAEGNSL
ncbi:hypothetical protein IE4872_PD02035 (plasmid) [Rhizobium gallicum]|uniref:Uncharacterized protein n=1 Tax=Rhizobium gallicum TaxID=56730 RepID=A0A1L5NXF8_9HYPH|nr:hypothetical protein [Rhizobium gallicum]APO72549.1 hypothetical protein IE4872_PD02035 [Rhizobium gallicum]